MATYEYDDFSITLTPRADASFDLLAVAPSGVRQQAVFSLPLSMDELEQMVVQMASVRSRAGHPRVATVEPPAVDAPTREVDPPAPSGAPDPEVLGSALGEALFPAEVGTAYDTALDTANSAQRGLRLTLSLGAAPALLSLPWEFLYRRPRFLASQRHTPLVRRLDTGSLAAPPAITSTVRILGVVSSPSDLAPLDVAAERRLVEQAVAKMVSAGRVELDWLEPATPRSLREALRDNSYHIMHYVGHSSFTDDDGGAIYLEDDSGKSSQVDSTVLANLLGDQNTLRLVVLNSCEGARTTLKDPYAGVATTLIQLGVPAVVAMQFEISDEAAILFADELYTNLIGRQDPIDAAVAEARKAIYVQIDRIEWATPVLFVRNPDVQLFDFRLPVAALPPTPAAEAADDTGELGARSGGTNTPSGGPPPLLSSAAAAAAAAGRPDVAARSGRRNLWLIAAGIAAVLVSILALVTALSGSDRHTPAVGATTLPATTGTATGAAAVATAATLPPAPRPHTGFLSVQVREPLGDTHLYPIRLSTQTVGVITNATGATDSQAAWDPATNRVAFTRTGKDGTPLGISYVIPGNFAGDGGKQVARLVQQTAPSVDHFPAWTSASRLFYLRTAGCAAGPACVESLRLAEFAAAPSAKDPKFADTLTPLGTDRVVADRQFTNVSAIAADPARPGHVAVADAAGIWLVSDGTPATLFAPKVVTTSMTFTPDGSFLVAVTSSAGLAVSTDRTFSVYTPAGVLLGTATIVGDTANLHYVSITSGGADGNLLALAHDDSTPLQWSVVRLVVNGVGTVTRGAEIVGGSTLTKAGTPQAIAL